MSYDAAYHKQWYNKHKNKKSFLRQRSSSHYKRKYGISLEDYEVLYKKQNGKCFLCNKKGFKPTQLRGRGNMSFLVVDHCHKNNKIRKLLCQECNRGLGLFYDNPALLTKAAKYLRMYK